MFIEVEGFVLTEVSYKETSKILNIFTKEKGIIGVIAKGAKRMKSPIRSYAQKFIFGRFSIKYKENGLSILISAEVVDPLKNINNDLLKISYLSYIADLSNQTFKESGDIEIYDLFTETLLKMENGLNPVVLSNILELKYLKYLGVEPNFSVCSKCSLNKKIVTIDLNTCDLICEDCYKGEKIISNKILNLLKIYENIDIKSLGKIKIEDEFIKQINLYLKNYYDYYTGLYLYTKNYLEKSSLFK